MRENLTARLFNLSLSCFAATVFLLSSQLSQAQQQSMQPMPVKDATHRDSIPKKTPRASHMHMNMHMNMPMDSSMDMNMDMSMDSSMDMGMSMNSAYSLNLPMTRNGSGTSWLPDASTMNGYMVHSGEWMFMFHGDIFPRFNAQDIFHQGSRGGSKWDAPDMLMAMAQRPVGKKGLFHVNLMLSSDALIAGGNGYPLLFQTGESWHGVPLVDRQHPHDLFSELSVSYSYAFSKKVDAFAYFGYPGEPALGPVTFMHRPSGTFNPDAPIGHHWEDATHITFGVATLGIRVGQFKLEGSSFTGREPDENRYNFDKPRFDSWSGRLSFNPSENWALQVSHGYIKSPESLSPDENVNRTTASATYVYPFTGRAYLAATALWGQNKSAAQDPSNAALLEATLKWNRLVTYMRYEWVQKSVEELHLNPAIYGISNPQFPLQALTLGLGYDLFTFGHLIVAGGGQASVYRPATDLTGLYGQHPLAGEIYLHLYPGKM
jgi:hypothetical protein